MKDSQVETSRITECQHPEDKLVLEELGYMDFYAGDIADNLHQVVICKECGAVLIPNSVDDGEGILF